MTYYVFTPNYGVKMNSKNVQHYISELDGRRLSDNSALSVTLFDEEHSVLCIEVEYREEFPIYMTVDEGQILCITHLFSEDEVRADKMAEMNEDMLSLNISIPLSSFSKVGKQYVLFGALSPQSSIDDLLHEIELLSDNVLEAIEALVDYLNEVK